MSNVPNSSGFAITRWTLVERTRGNTADAKAALRELCRDYYSPVVAFLRHEGHGDDGARELAHEFFVELIERESIGNPQRARGRFRSYLLGAVKHFLMNWRRAAAQKKRGGGVVHLEIGPATDVVDECAFPSDAIFDREWALAIVNRALVIIEKEHESANRAAQFAVLKPWISPTRTMRSQAEVAEELDMSEAAVKVAIHRLRRRFRDLVREDIVETLEDPADLDAELGYLIQALIGGSV